MKIAQPGNCEFQFLNGITADIMKTVTCVARGPRNI